MKDKKYQLLSNQANYIYLKAGITPVSDPPVNTIPQGGQLEGMHTER